MGDPNGIGPELVLKARRDGELAAGLVLIGDSAILDECAARTGITADYGPIRSVEEAVAGRLNVLEEGAISPSELAIGEVSEPAGRAALRYVERAAHLALAGKVDAVVTLPINKEAVRLSSPQFTGHTELVAEIAGVRSVTMMLASKRLIVTHVSTHVSLQEAIARVARERIVDVIRLTDDALHRLRPRRRIAVAGLNPHAGEHGAFGAEEEREIRPAVDAARHGGIDAVGPEPPDTVFFRALAGEFDAVACMYHDQGHIAMKLVDFESAVNVTLGLPFVRTSVDHGTAYDIAYQGIASTRSFIEAFRLAGELSATS